MISESRALAMCPLQPSNPRAETLCPYRTSGPAVEMTRSAKSFEAPVGLVRVAQAQVRGLAVRLGAEGSRTGCTGSVLQGPQPVARRGDAGVRRVLTTQDSRVLLCAAMAAAPIPILIILSYTVINEAGRISGTFRSGPAYPRPTLLAGRSRCTSSPTQTGLGSQIIGEPNEARRIKDTFEILRYEALIANSLHLSLC
jgi:hypothetical protein